MFYIPEKYWRSMIEKNYIKRECEFTKPVKTWGPPKAHKECNCPYLFTRGESALEEAILIQ